MLREYRKKRNFQKTTEPKTSKAVRKNTMMAPKAPLFVIQEHNASHWHLDLRLEYRRTLKSWAVPKGIPKLIGEKVLAVQTEDHPLAYANFEGIIPKGEYGAGTVKMYDRGFYENLTHDKDHKPISMKQAFENGHLTFRLHGKRFKNKVFALHRFRREKKDMWLLMPLDKK